ncbi:MAG TPA: hypothetical protein VKK79_16585 [Candidatus Lokiarchaeia archaeon]|nr:hypothetical protein [Candidatus Lokiarchaeia archaeon]
MPPEGAKSIEIGSRLALLGSALEPFLQKLSGLLVDRLATRIPVFPTIDIIILPETPPETETQKSFFQYRLQICPRGTQVTKVAHSNPRFPAFSGAAATWEKVCTSKTTFLTEYYAGRISTTVGRPITPLFLYYLNVLFDRLGEWTPATTARNRVLAHFLPKFLMDKMRTTSAIHWIQHLPPSIPESIIVLISKLGQKSSLRKENPGGKDH